MLKAPIRKRADRQTLLSKSVKVLSHPDFAVSVVFRLRCHSTDQHPHPKKVDPRPDCSSLYHILSAKKPEKAGIFKRSFFIQTLSWEYYMALVASKFPIKANWRSVWFLPKMASLYLQKIAHYSAYMENFCCSAFWVGWCWKCLWQSLVCSHHFGI